jgi:transcriptional regulator with XRE-family HTH domain
MTKNKNQPIKSFKELEMIEKFNIKRAGSRLRTVRILNGITRPQLCDALGISSDRLRNLETHKQKLNEEDFESISMLWPIFTDYIVKSGHIRLDPSNETIKQLASSKLLEDPQRLKEAQAIKDVSGIDLVRAALIIPAFRKTMCTELNKMINEATKKARKDAR